MLPVFTASRYVMDADRRCWSNAAASCSPYQGWEPPDDTFRYMTTSIVCTRAHVCHCFSLPFPSSFLRIAFWKWSTSVCESWDSMQSFPPLNFRNFLPLTHSLSLQGEIILTCVFWTLLPLYITQLMWLINIKRLLFKPRNSCRHILSFPPILCV
jgi:hypothetical protein